MFFFFLTQGQLKDDRRRGLCVGEEAGEGRAKQN